MKIVRGLVTGALIAALAVALGACGPIGVHDSRLVLGGEPSVSALDGYIRFGVPQGGTEGEPRVRFRLDPLPADRPATPGIVTVGDMVTMEVEGGSISRGRITIDYEDLPAGVRPEMLNVFAWSADLGGWVPLPNTLTDAADRSISGDTVLFDSFVLGTWQLSPDEIDGDTVTTGAGTRLAVGPEAYPSFWSYARSAAVAAVNETVGDLTRTVSDGLVCEPRAANVSVAIATAPAGRVDACVVAGTGSQQVRIRNRYPFPLALKLPAGGQVWPAPAPESTGGPAGSLTAARNAALAYLNGTIALGGGETITLRLPPGRSAPVWLSGRLDWSVVALDAGLRQLDLLLPNSRALRPGTADLLLQAHAEHGAAARAGLARGDVADPSVQALLRTAGLSEAGRSVGDLFEFSDCVLRRTPEIYGSAKNVLSNLPKTGPSITQITSDCLVTIYDKYLLPGTRSTGGVLDTLKSATATVRKAVPAADRRPGYGAVSITITPR
ncbi:hypothetical protein [Actinoplanes utahensis]|uniref:Lipoprotein n=1 Tax=Actinoplanes utahensis TaxID=1869 RepID=A0A0A6UPX5_ACTUT|nr:hypothetical protein [Actinoplanes utahensis]KHD76389.1 hypothetical protein MB27_16870 [Actinoplanes utahensis]GIF29840.1 hypothetical protein Aut01nite_28260 [Actinoplanes utahensis]